MTGDRFVTGRVDDGVGILAAAVVVTAVAVPVAGGRTCWS